MKFVVSVVSIFLLMNQSTFAGEKEQTIKFSGIKVKFTVPSSDYKLAGDQKQGNTLMKVYNCPEIKTETRTVIPTIGFLFEKLNEDVDPLIYFTMKRSRLGFKPEELYSNSNDFMKMPNSVGLVTMASSGGEVHRILFITSIHKGVGIQVLIDTTADTYAQVENTFKEILKSIQVD